MFWTVLIALCIVIAILSYLNTNLGQKVIKPKNETKFNPDVWKRENSHNFLNNSSTARRTPALETTRENYSFSELARRSLRGTAVNESISSESMHGYSERHSVNSSVIKRNDKKVFGQQNYPFRSESSKTNNSVIPLRDSFLEKRSPVLLSKRAGVNIKVSQRASHQNKIKNNSLLQISDVDILGLLDDDSAFQKSQTQYATGTETTQIDNECEFISPKPSAFEILPRCLSTPTTTLMKSDSSSVDEIQLVSNTKSSKEKKTPVPLKSLKSPDKNISTSPAMSCSPKTYMPTKRNGESSDQTQRPGSNSSLNDSQNHTQFGHPGNFKSVHTSSNLNNSGKVQTCLKYSQDYNMDTENKDSIPAAMDLDGLTSLNFATFSLPMDGQMESLSDMQLGIEINQDSVWDLEKARKCEWLVREKQILETLLSKNNKSSSVNEEAMNCDEINKHTTSHSLIKTPRNLSGSVNTKLNPGNQNASIRKVLCNINQTASEPTVEPKNHTKKVNLNPHPSHQPQLGRISRPDINHKDINQFLQINIASVTHVGVSGQNIQAAVKSTTQMSSSFKAAGNILDFHVGLKQVEHQRNISKLHVTVPEKRKRSGKSEELEFINDTKAKKTKLSEFPNHLAKRIARRIQIKKLIHTKWNDVRIGCWICLEKIVSSQSIWCPCKHQICLLCIKAVIKGFLSTEIKLHLKCPVQKCGKIIDIDLVKQLVDPLIFEFLKKALLERQEQANQEVMEYLFQKISCLGCKTIATMDKKAIHFKCRICHKEYCSYCHKDWPGSNLHHECRLLNCSGTKCFQELHVGLPPDNWEQSYSALASDQIKPISGSKCSLVNLKGIEGRAIIRLFIQTSPEFFITQITRLQNLKLWEKYVLKRKHMVDEIGLSNINERALFHGTNEKNMPLICEEGFDIRVETSNGALFGKGTYFSTTSKYSQNYAGLSNKMFITRVLCGYSVQGKLEYTRPPKDKSGRMYDCCVNIERNPLIYCLFDSSQCYPAYIIEYKKKK